MTTYLVDFYTPNKVTLSIIAKHSVCTSTSHSFSYGSKITVTDLEELITTIIKLVKDSKQMPPPKFAPIKKRKTKKEKEGTPKTSPTTPVVTPTSGRMENSISLSLPSIYQDSDSDSAYGFGSDWSQQ
ncbi:hypothetical protein Avbf_16276 [Armadillidium vulgare]|nr:hypothetical protein Avbf_16276 [Armadillidium vulgare]